MSIQAFEKPILKYDLLKANEVFIVGTTVEITPIIHVDDVVIDNGKPGKITQRLQQAYQQLVHSSI